MNSEHYWHIQQFVADFSEDPECNANRIIVWLRGGNTTYSFRALEVP